MQTIWKSTSSSVSTERYDSKISPKVRSEDVRVKIGVACSALI